MADQTVTQRKKLPEQTSGLNRWQPGQSLLVSIQEPSTGTRRENVAGEVAIWNTEGADVAEDPSFYATRQSSSARRLNTTLEQKKQFQQGNKRFTYHGDTPIPQRRTASKAPDQQMIGSRVRDTPLLSPPTYAQGRPKLHWLVFAGVAMMTMIIGWVAFSALASWWQVTQDDWHYGRPRTFQIDTVIGHNDSIASPTHFIALNLSRHIQIIEIPGGDATKAKIFVGPLLIGQDQDLMPVTLTFKDVTGNGKLDMIVNVGDSHFVYINENGSFRVATPRDTIHM